MSHGHLLQNGALFFQIAVAPSIIISPMGQSYTFMLVTSCILSIIINARKKFLDPSLPMALSIDAGSLGQGI